MVMRLDEFMLLGLTGLVDWTVVQPSAASQRDTSYTSTDTWQQTQTYLALLTELTPTVLTGRSSASVNATPLVYATVSSLIELEKLGPRQLRLRQEQFDVTGRYRLLYLTTPSAVACDEWWQVLYCLTKDHRHHLLSNAAPAATAPSFHPDPENGDLCCDLAAFLTGSPVAPAPERSHEVSDVTELQQLLLFTPSSTCPVTAGRSSYRLRGGISQSLPTATQLSVNDLRTSPPLVCPQRPEHGSPRDRKIRHPVAAPLPSDLIVTCDAATVTAAAVTGSSLSSFQCNSAPAGTDMIPSVEKPMSLSVWTASLPWSTVPVRDGDRGHLAQTRKPTSTSALTRCLPTKSPVPSAATGNEDAHLSGAPAAAMRRIVAPPSLCTLLGSGTDLCCESASVSTALASSTASTRGGGVAERDADVSSQALAAETVAPQTSSALRREHVESKRPTGVASHPVFFSSAATGSSTAQPLWNPPVSPRVSRHQSPLQDPLEHQSPPLTRRGVTAPTALTSSEAVALPQASTAGRTLSPLSFAYEPVHVDSITVSRARGNYCSSPCRRLTSPSSAMELYLLHWYGRGTPSFTPRIMYHNVSPLQRQSIDSKDNRFRIRFDSAAVPTSGQRRNNRHCRRLRSAARRQYSLSSPAYRSRHAGAADAPATPPLLSVIAQPHMFLKYPVQVSSPCSSDKDGAGASGAATYVFLTLDEECVVTVPAAHFKKCIEEANLLQRHKVRGVTAGAEHLCSGAVTVSVGVRSLERARHFFGEKHCRAMPVAEVVRVSRGDEEPLLLLNSAQRERFRDLSMTICIATQKHAFILEAKNSTDAARYVGSWKAYLRSRRRSH
ncbi:hypothetical protein, conserved [Leishmania tarentolae]|uniref:Kinetoplastid PH-like domain-containing protein n=1 Tax=Leishmania tarentolae TaxID=5689 RepID=A0A640KUV1_LEITA|nr:hypothetical protein, conserved [Leishmania tarentolae]